jgi:hypothetical protein
MFFFMNMSLDMLGTLWKNNPGDTYSWQYKGNGNMGVQRAWSEIMNVLVNPKGSVGRWNLNFWRLEQFYTNFWSKDVVDTYSKPKTYPKQTKKQLRSNKNDGKKSWWMYWKLGVPSSDTS